MRRLTTMALVAAMTGALSACSATHPLGLLTMRNIPGQNLSGIALAPAGLFANNSGGVISSNGGSVVSSHGGSVISANTANLVAGYSLQDAEGDVAVAGATAWVLDCHGDKVPGVLPVITDGRGA